MDRIQAGRAADLTESAAREIFRATLALELEASTPFLDPSPLLKSDVVAATGLTGDLSGYLSIHCDSDQAVELTARMTKLDRDVIVASPDVIRDAFSELANMVAGGAKSQFDGLDISISLPNVIIGHNHNVSASKNAPRVVIPCSTPAGSFTVEVAMVLGKPTGGVSGQTSEVGARS